MRSPDKTGQVGAREEVFDASPFPLTILESHSANQYPILPAHWERECGLVFFNLAFASGALGLEALGCNDHRNLSTAGTPHAQHSRPQLSFLTFSVGPHSQLISSPWARVSLTRVLITSPMADQVH